METSACVFFSVILKRFNVSKETLTLNVAPYGRS